MPQLLATPVTSHAIHLILSCPLSLSFAGSWVFLLSALFAFLWFNPFALEVRYVLGDIRLWLRWVRGLDGTKAELSYATWIRTSTSQYAGCPWWTKIYHTIRLLRFPALATGILFRAAIVHSSLSSGVSEGIFLGAMFLVPFVFLCLLQVIDWTDRKYCGQPELPAERSAMGSAPNTMVLPRRPLRRILQIILIALMVAAAIILVIFGAVDSNLTGGATIEILMCFLIMCWFYAKVLVVLQITALHSGAYSVLKGFDVSIGAFLLGIQLLASFIPFGASSHNALLFAPKYARILEVVLGAKPSRGQQQITAGSAPRAPQNSTASASSTAPR